MTENSVANPGGLRVLVIDDELVISKFVKRITEKMGCNFNNITDATTVGSALLAAKPEVIFLDLMMPDVDGVEVIKQLSDLKCAAKLILMSGLDQRTVSSVAEVARNGGLDVLGAITKPFQPGQIEGLLEPVIADRFSAQTAKGSAADKASAGDLPGPRLLLTPELSVDDPQADTMSWYRARLVWVLDNGQYIDMDSALDQSVLKEGARGVMVYTLGLIPGAVQVLGLNEAEIGIRLFINFAILLHPEAPDFLSDAATALGLKSSNLSFEISETAISGQSDALLNSLSRLKIKGFKISVRVRSEIDSVLAGLNKLPVDEIAIDMSQPYLSGSALQSSETEFQIGSVVSFAAKRDLLVTAINLTEPDQLDFARRCKFNRVSGPAIS